MFGAVAHTKPTQFLVIQAFLMYEIADWFACNVQWEDFLRRVCEQEAKQPVTPTPPEPSNACSEQLTEQENIRKYCTPSGVGHVYFICFYTI